MTSTHPWQVVCLKDAQPAPWRNGGGTTRGLVAWPNKLNWHWRVSVAEVGRSGPFSRFAGVRRWFAVLEGEGMCLTVAGTAHTLDASSEPLEFDGEALTDCKLLGRSTQDFNLMVKGGSVAVLRRVRGSMAFKINAPGTIAAYAQDAGAIVQMGHETFELPAGCFGWIAVSADAAVSMTAVNALFMEISV